MDEPTPHRAEPPLLVVGVGASGGGLDAFRELLSTLGDPSGLVLLLIQHLDPTHPSSLAELLAPHTPMRVREAVTGAALEPGHVWVIAPDSLLAVQGRHLHVSTAGRSGNTGPPTAAARSPTDYLFLSLAASVGPSAVAIVLTGDGSDGSEGLRAIHAAGGLTIAQAPETAAHPEMPRAAIDTGAVDLVVPIAEIPVAVARFAELARPVEITRLPGGSPAPTVDDLALERLAESIPADAQIDLRCYKPATLRRRVCRRIVAGGFSGFESYLTHLRTDASEQRALVRDLLIGVTDFFRDREVFDALAELVIGPLLQDARRRGEVRVWVPGCATGEEAYSIAILLLERMSHAPVSLQLFATDIDEDALAVARAGVYPRRIEDRLAPGLLERYFERHTGGCYRVRPHLRDVVSFAGHDLARDPPFSRIDLVSCRNVLIYLRPAVQERVMRALHFALRPGGYLLLGSSESPGSQGELFSEVSKKARIFRKAGTSRALAVGVAPLATRRGPAPVSSIGRRAPVEDAVSLARRAVLRDRVPPTIVVDAAGNVLFMTGELRPYLRFPQGEARLQLSGLLDSEIATRARAAIYKCRRDGGTVTATSSPDRADGRRTRLVASPAVELGADAVILSFEDLPAASQRQPDDLGVSNEPSPASHIRAVVRREEGAYWPYVTDEQRSHRGEGAAGWVQNLRRGHLDDGSAPKESLAELERELQATRDDLRHTVEELESSNEELRAAHEQTLSMNEELQSANEELEATTEELRSLNEELTTVNAQLREKVEQLEQANEDLANFFASTDIATVFLDGHLRIARFTPAAERMVRIGRGDEGRSVGDIAREHLQNGLVDEARRVLDSREPSSRELHLADGRWIIRRVLPYHSESLRNEGVVVTLVDVTALKEATARLAIREQQQAVIARLGLAALETTGLQGFLDQTVRELQQHLAGDFCKILELQPPGDTLLLRAGVGWREGAVGVATVGSDLDSQAGYTLQTSGPVIVEDLSEERRFRGPPLLREHGVVSGMSCTIRGSDEPYGVLGIHTRTPRSFTAEDAHFLQSAAAVVAGAIGRHGTRKRLTLEGGLVEALTQADSLPEALTSIHAAMAGVLGPGLGELWEPSGESGALVRRAIFPDPPLTEHTAAEQLGPDRVERGEGLAGRVARSCRAEWLSISGAGPEVSALSRLELASGVALPVCDGPRLFGVVTHYSRRRLHADHVFLHSLESLGRSLASFARNLEEIAARRAVEDDLRESEARFRQVLMSSPVPLLLYDDHGTCLALSDSWTQVTGYSLDDMPTIERWFELAYRERAEEMKRFGRAVLADATASQASETEIWTREETRRTLSFRSVHLGKTREGRHLRLVAAADVTPQRRYERDLIEAARQKDEFLAMLGHELRNPLAAVRSATELLSETQPEPQLLDRLRTVLERQTSHMAKLLDGLLDISRVVSGKIDLDRRNIDLRTVVTDVTSDVEQRTDGRLPALAVTLPDAPVPAEADPVRLTQVVDNLLTNAVKHTPREGHIDVRLTTVDGHAVLEVRDDGEGIERELLPRIFQPFQQGRQKLDRKNGGLGIGLALVKNLVELHGGDVAAHSEGRGHGATLTVRLPLAQRHPRRSPRPTQRDGRARVLIVEDNDDAATLLRAVLELRGHEVMLASTGADGLAMARALLPDLVFCDLGLPDDLSGYDVAEALRADPRTRAVRLVALSGYGGHDASERSLRAGFDRHLTKPVTAETLDRVLAEPAPS